MHSGVGEPFGPPDKPVRDGRYAGISVNAPLDQHTGSPDSPWLSMADKELAPGAVGRLATILGFHTSTR